MNIPYEDGRDECICECDCEEKVEKCYCECVCGYIDGIEENE